MVMSRTLEEHIRSVYDDLSPSHRRLVEYLLEHSNEAALSTARQLAETLGISESTVVRVAPELGYDGFPALQAEFQQRLLSRIQWRAPLLQDIETMPRDPMAVLHLTLENDIRSIEHTLATVTPESFEKAVTALLEANTIYILGLRTSAAHAIYAAMRLRLVRPKTRLLSPDFGDLADQMLALERGDLLLTISYLRYAANTLRALEYARARSVRTLVVTDYPVSPPARIADIVLISHSPTSRLSQSVTAPLSLLNALITAVAVVDKNNSDRNIATAYDAIEGFDVLLAPEISAESHQGLERHEFHGGSSDDARAG